MGFYEYYRAADRETAITQPEHSRVIANPKYDVPRFDAVEETKWLDPWGTLNELVALIGDVDLSTELVATVHLYPLYPDPAPQTDEEWDALPEDSPYLSDMGIEELSTNVRDLLAGAADAHLPRVVERWAKSEQFSHFSSADLEYLMPVAKDLIGLSRRAKDHGQQLYCWSCA
ncbi:hypothetical protein [Streptosporangium subroseum]|uniref:hypothetical protein n=1 Tax=Streptosporangium subroseum TaxID=106412 RepID=UPI00309336B9|nr:hypothetical protein OHB15_48165 [Streptosporangium subroseum]